MLGKLPSYLLLSAVALVSFSIGCGQIGQTSERKAVLVDHRMDICRGLSPRYLCPRISEDGGDWLPVERGIDGFRATWGVTSEIVVIERSVTPLSLDAQDRSFTYERTLDQRTVEPGTTFVLGQKMPWAQSTGELLRITAPKAGKFVDGKKFVCADERQCSRIEELRTTAKFSLRMSYQTEVEGPLKVEEILLHGSR